MNKYPLPRRVALLIDADNTKLCSTSQILGFAKQYGELTICRAYGDWKQPPLSSWCKKLAVLDVKLEQQARSGKNATDYLLMIEAGEILGADEADVFAIVSGDGDFESLCRRIKQKGKQVIGIGNKNHTSEGLQRVCHKFFFVEDIVTELAEFEALLARAMLEISQKDGWVHYAPLGQKLRQLYPNFESRFGNRKLSEWLSNFNTQFEICEQKVRSAAAK